jgi:DNA-directed RNA polymerase subunit F
LLHKQGGFMDRYFRKETAERAGASSPSEAWLFAQALLDKPVPSASAAEADARAKREHFEFLAAIAPERARELRGQLSEEADATAQREQLEWLAAISPSHESQLRSLLRTEAEAQEHLNWPADDSNAQEAQWDSAKHPKGGFPENRGWWSPTSGSGNAERAPSFLDAVIQRNRTVADLSGVVTPGMIRSSRLAIELQSAARLPDDVASAAAAGLVTGAKAVVNGFATAIKNVARPVQLVRQPRRQLGHLDFLGEP